MVKNPPAKQETRVQSLGREDPLEKEMATPFRYSCLGNLTTKGSLVGYTAHAVARVRHD